MDNKSDDAPLTLGLAVRVLAFAVVLGFTSSGLIAVVAPKQIAIYCPDAAALAQFLDPAGASLSLGASVSFAFGPLGRAADGGGRRPGFWSFRMS